MKYEYKTIKYYHWSKIFSVVGMILLLIIQLETSMIYLYNCSLDALLRDDIIYAGYVILGFVLLTLDGSLVFVLLDYFAPYYDEYEVKVRRSKK